MAKHYPSFVLAAGLFGCGGHHGGGGGGSAPLPAPAGPGPEGPAPAPDPGGDALRGPYPAAFQSDIRDAQVPACGKAQPFALETCYDRVVFSDQGDLALEGTAGRLDILTAGVVSSKVLEHYQFAEGDWRGQEVVNDRLTALHQQVLLGWYWFMPDTMVTTKPTAGEPVRLAAATFPLLLWDAFPGTAKICGKELPLPLTEGGVEEACQIEIGDQWSGQVSNAAATTTFEVEMRITGDTAPGQLRRRKIARIIIQPALPNGGQP